MLRVFCISLLMFLLAPFALAQESGLVSRMDRVEKKIDTVLDQVHECEVVCPVSEREKIAIQTRAARQETALELATQRCILLNVFVGIARNPKEIKIYRSQDKDRTKIFHNRDGRREVATTDNSCAKTS